MRFAIDTNRYIDLSRGEEEVVRRIEEAEEVFVPFVVIAELRAGFAVGARGHANEQALNRFLSEPGINPLFADDITTQTYAMLYRQLRQQGTPIPTNDLWIAALAAQHGLSLYSRDVHFRNLAQLDLL